MTTNNGTTPQTAEEMVTALKASIAAVKPRKAVCGCCALPDGWHKWRCPGATAAVKSGNYSMGYNFGVEAFKAVATDPLQSAEVAS